MVFWSLNVAPKWVSFISCFHVIPFEPFEPFVCDEKIHDNITLLDRHTIPTDTCGYQKRFKWKFWSSFFIPLFLHRMYANRIRIVKRFCQKHNENLFFERITTRNWIIWFSRIELAVRFQSLCRSISKKKNVLSLRFLQPTKQMQTKPNQYSKTPPWPEVIKSVA